MTEFKMPKEMFNLWKSSLDNYVKSVKSMQEQGDKMLEMMLTQSDGFRDEMKKVIKESASQVKELQESYIQALQDNIKKVEDMISDK